MYSQSEYRAMKSIRTPQRNNRRNIALGLILVFCSGLGVWWTIQVNNHTQEYLITNQPAASGSEVTNGSFHVARMNLGESGKLYLRPGELTKSAYLLVGVDAGQLIPKSLIASSALDERVPVVITSRMPLPSKVRVGDLVDIWVSKSNENNQYAKPVQVVIDAEIADIVQTSGIMNDQALQVQVLVPSESVSPILDAIASKDALSLVLKRNLGND